MLEIHHVIPRELAKHPRVQHEGYQVEAGYNTIFAPSAAASAHVRLHPHRPVHSGGHAQYNQFGRNYLDVCPSGADAFLMLLVVCHQGSRGRWRIPWST